MEEGDVVAPATRCERIEGRLGVLQPPRAPHMTIAASEALQARLHALDPGTLPDPSKPLGREAPPEVADARARGSRRPQPNPARRRGRQPAARRGRRPPRRRAEAAADGTENSSMAMRPPGFDDAGELPHGRRRVVDVAEQVGEGQPGESGVVEGKVLGAALAELDALGEAGGRDPRASCVEHLRALVDADDLAAVPAGELDRDGRRPRGDVEHGVARPGLDPRDEKRAPARVLPEAEQARVAIVGLRRAARRALAPRGSAPRMAPPRGYCCAPWSSTRS